MDADAGTKCPPPPHGLCHSSHRTWGCLSLLPTRLLGTPTSTFVDGTITRPRTPVLVDQREQLGRTRTQTWNRGVGGRFTSWRRPLKCSRQGWFGYTMTSGIKGMPPVVPSQRLFPSLIAPVSVLSLTSYGPQSPGSALMCMGTVSHQKEPRVVGVGPSAPRSPDPSIGTGPETHRWGGGLCAPALGLHVLPKTESGRFSLWKFPQSGVLGTLGVPANHACPEELDRCCKILTTLVSLVSLCALQWVAAVPEAVVPLKLTGGHRCHGHVVCRHCCYNYRWVNEPSLYARCYVKRSLRSFQTQSLWGNSVPLTNAGRQGEVTGFA